MATRDRLFASFTKTARLAATIFAATPICSSTCDAQGFSVPGKVMRQEIVAPSQAPLPASPQAPARRPENTSIWGPLFKAQVERCWKKPAGSGAIEAIFAIRLKRDGTLEAVYVVSSIDTTPYGRAYQTSGFRAIMDCQPYDLPQEAYEEWRFFEPVFTERRR